ncbi:MAG: ATP-binding protein, partial [Acidimicrobiales bacterium]
GARLLVHRTLRRYETERQPAVLGAAAEHFARVTDGRYQRLVVDSAPDGSNPTVQVVTENGSQMDATALSRGTIERLYLCLRLGLAESFADRYLPLPIVLDDVLVNFDPERARSVVDELILTADRHQVLFLTCHPHLAELISGRAPRAAVKELARI